MAKGSSTSPREPLFADVSDMVVMHKVVAAREALAVAVTLTQAQFQRCLAFELGLAEYFFAMLLQRDGGPEAVSDPAFPDFLRYHGNREYGDDAATVCELWLRFCAEGAMSQARKLGIESASKATSADGMHRPGERASRYFRQALGI